MRFSKPFDSIDAIRTFIKYTLAMIIRNKIGEIIMI